MLLCHKPSPFPLSPQIHHRRNPSAPSPVVVHPTCTPGLLSISKPTRPPQPHSQVHLHHHQRQSRTPRNKPAIQLRNRSPHAAVALAVISDSPKPSVEQLTLLQKQALITPVSSPDRNPRGRTQAKARKDKLSRRNASLSSPNGQLRRPNNRQPSPTQLSSQAEGPLPTRHRHKHSQSLSQRNNLKQHANLFDPFIVNSSSDSDSASDSTLSKDAAKSVPKFSAISPAIATRQPIPPLPDSPTPLSKTIPVPRHNHRVFENISRSDPVLSHMRPRPADHRRPLVVEWDTFPVCDDLAIDDPTPSTPTRARRVDTFNAASWGFSGPRTAPLSAKTSFPLSTPPQSPIRSRHRRAPSEGVFDMSLDEDITLTSSDDINAFVGAFSKKKSPTSNNIRVNKDKAGYFASSMFQNSPSPDELPPPTFGGRRL